MVEKVEGAVAGRRKNAEKRKKSTERASSTHDCTQHHMKSLVLRKFHRLGICATEKSDRERGKVDVYWAEG